MENKNLIRFDWAIKDEFDAQGIEKAKILWRVDNLSEEEKQIYLKHIENLRYSASMVWSMKVDEEDRIKKENSLQIAKSLKTKGIAIEVIIEATGLSRDEIEKI